MYKRLLTIIFASAVAFAVVATAPTALAAASPSSSTPSTSTTATGGSPDVLVPAVAGPSVNQRLVTRAKASWPWYITRAAGLVAAAALVILLLSGVGLITGFTFKFLEPLTAWATHRAIGITFAVAAVVHVGALLFDHYVSFNIVQVLVPFASNYRTVTIAGHHLGSLYVALGVIAMYLVAAMLISTYLWIDKKPRTWKAFHYLAYLIIIFIFVHALYLGTDLAHGFFRYLWIGSGVAVALAILVRLRRARSI